MATKATKKAAKGTTKRRRSRKGANPKQTQIPGTERKKDKQLARLAEKLYDTRIKRIDLQKQERMEHSALLLAMKNKKAEVYEDPDLGLLATLKPGVDKVSVVSISDDD